MDVSDLPLVGGAPVSPGDVERFERELDVAGGLLQGDRRGDLDKLHK